MAEFIQFLSDNALKELQLANKELVTMVANVDKVGQKMKGISTPSGSDSAIKSLTEQYKEQERVIKSLQGQITKLTQVQDNNTNSKKKEVQAILDQSKSYQQLEKQKNKEIALAEREAQKLAAAENLYNKVQVKMNALSNEYKALAVRRELGINLTDREEKRYSSLQNRIQMYDKTLKAVDASMGKYQRNVGNYASGFNPLSNSINQLTREMPAFTYSVQTGFMAISNNLPIFFDAMQGVINQNKELQAQGKPTTSVLKQLAGSIFSFQTLLGVGITLLTVYGKEIGEWVMSLKGANSALEELNKRQKEFNESKKGGRREAQAEIIELRKYLSVVKDEKISLEERNIALKQLRSQFPFYFKNLTDAQILAGKYAKAENDLTIALEKRKEVEKKTELNVLNKQELLDLQNKTEELQIQLKSEKEYFELNKERLKQQVSGAGLDKRLATETTIAQLTNQIAQNEITREEITKKIIENDTAIFQLKKETIGLEYQEEKNGQSKLDNQKRLNLEMEDYLASQYELNRLLKEMESEMNEGQFDNEGMTLENRLNAYTRFIENRKELSELDYEEQKRLQLKFFEDTKKSLNEEYNDYISSDKLTATQRIEAKKELNKALETLSKKHNLDLEVIEVSHSNRMAQITIDSFEKIRKINEQYNNLEQNKLINEKELRDLQEHQKKLENIYLKTTLKRINEIDKLNTEAQQETARQRIQLRINEITEQLKYVQRGSADELKLRAELYQRQKEYTILELADLEKKKQEQIEYLKLLETTYNNFFNDFAGQSGFSGFLDLFAGGLDKFKGDAVATALTVSEAFQQAFNTIVQYSNANFEQMYRNLEQQRDVSILFAGESATAREEIERQYEERRRRIQRQQAEAQKRMALFNIAVNTAQAIVSALAMTPPNVPLSVAVGLIGAIQASMVASQPIPAFEKGGIHDGGLMLVNDGKGSNYAEKVVTPDGKVHEPKGRNVVMNAPKGTKIFTHDQWKDQLNNILLSNGINSVQPQTQQQAPIVNVQTKDNYHFSIDEQGIRKTITRGATKTQILNARFKQQKRDV